MGCLKESLDGKQVFPVYKVLLKLRSTFLQSQASTSAYENLLKIPEEQGFPNCAVEEQEVLSMLMNIAK